MDTRAVPDPGRASTLPVVHAGFVSRFIAFVIDLCVLAALVSASHWLLATVDTLLRPWAQLDLSATFIASIPLIIAVYFVGLWRVAGQTVGKWLLGLRVVDEYGHRINVTQGLARLAGYMVSALPLYAGFVWVLFDPARLALHDHIARTRVVYVHARRLRGARAGA